MCPHQPLLENELSLCVPAGRVHQALSHCYGPSISFALDVELTKLGGPSI